MKYLLSFILSLAAFLPIAADETSNITIRLSDGTDYSFPSDNLVLAVSDGKLIAQSTAGEHTFDLAELKSMSFTPGTVGISAIDTLTGEVKIFSPSGIDMGTYRNAAEAMHSLPSGIYVIKTSTETFKICVP